MVVIGDKQREPPRESRLRGLVELAVSYGEVLLTYTDGGHRRINLEYLRLLLDD